MTRHVAPETVERMDQLAELIAEGCPSISEAVRRMGLVEAHPGETFVITREVARVGVRPVSRSNIPLTRRPS